MHRVTELLCISPGVPTLDGVRWRTARIEVVRKRDPFSGKVIDIPSWIPGESTPGPEALVRCRVPIADKMLDGHLFELVAIVLLSKPTGGAVAPRWMNDLGDGLVVIAPEIVGRLAVAEDRELHRLSEEWSQQPYLVRAEEGLRVAAGWLQALRAAASHAEPSDSVYARATAPYVSMTA